MRIKTRLRLNALLAICLGLVVLLTLSYAILLINDSRKTVQVAASIVKGVAELESITYDYVAHPGERPRQQWELKYASLGKLLYGEPFPDKQEFVVVRRTRSNYERVKPLFTQVVTPNTEGKPIDNHGSPLTETKDRIVAQLLARTQMMSSDAFLLSSMSAETIGSVLRTSLLVVFSSIVLLMVAMAGSSTFLSRTIMRSLSGLRKGTETIARGDLDYRILTSGRDELSELADSFNQMTTGLKDVTASKMDLEKEIAEREKIEEVLHESEQRWATTLASIGDAVIATDVEGKTAFMNAIAEGLTGWTLRDASQRPVAEVFHIINEYTRGEVENPVTKVLREGMVVGLANHTILVRKDGTEVPIDDSGAPIRDKEGKTTGVVLVFRDITERKRSEERTERLASFPQLNPAPVIETDTSGEITFCNPGTLRVLQDLGMDGEDCEAFLPEDLDAILRDWDKKNQATLEREVMLADRVLGETVHLVPQFNVARIYARDITEQKRAEKRILRQNRLLEGINRIFQETLSNQADEDLARACLRVTEELTGSKFGFINEIGPDGHLHDIAVSDPGWEVCKMTGTAGHRKLSATFKIHGIYGRVFTDGKGFFTNDPASHPDSIGLPSGHPPLTAFLGVPLIKEGRVIGIVAVGNRDGGYTEEELETLEALAPTIVEAFQRKRAEEALRKAHDELDMRVKERTTELQQAYDRLKKETTERERMEEQLRQSQKMEAVGTLAGGIAHDFNNMLAAIIGNAELAMDDVPEEMAARHNLDQIFKAGMRARGLVRQILTFSRKTEHERKPIPLTPLVNETFKMLRASLPTTIEMQLNIDTVSDVVLADPVQIQQILMNLCTNAGDAMRAAGGRLEVSLADTVLGGPLPEEGMQPGAYVTLTVSDTGPGMDEEVKSRIFEPFFTTKERGQGTGMGLAVVYGIVKSHQGVITVASQPGQGATFTVHLPHHTSAEKADDPTSRPVPKGMERILFVDDEELLVEMVEGILDRLGYKVLGKTDSVDALQTFAKDPSVFDLVITDHTMPQMTGAVLAQKLKEIRPNIPIILCTGYSETISEEKAESMGIDGFVMKPLSKNELAEAVRRVLDKNVET